ncbi:MAG: OB-fold nucleic acid binding domain-containing protein [Sulfolobales archaeon]
MDIEDESVSGKTLKISELRENMNNVSVIARVISTTKPRVIQTKKGARTISEAIIGDETGRVKLTLWGPRAGSVKEEDVIKIDNAWTTSYRGEVQLNAGSRSVINVVEIENFPTADQVPNNTPQAYTRESRERGYRGFGKRGRGWRE